MGSSDSSGDAEEGDAPELVPMAEAVVEVGVVVSFVPVANRGKPVSVGRALTSGSTDCGTGTAV